MGLGDQQGETEADEAARGDGQLQRGRGRADPVSDDVAGDSTSDDVDGVNSLAGGAPTVICRIHTSSAAIAVTSTAKTNEPTAVSTSGRM